MKVKNLYIGKIETIIEIRRVPIRHDVIKFNEDDKVISIIDRKFDTFVCGYTLVRMKNDKSKMIDLMSRQKYPYPEVINEYSSSELEYTQFVSEYCKASELLPVSDEDEISRFKAKKLFKQLKDYTIREYFKK